MDRLSYGSISVLGCFAFCLLVGPMTTDAQEIKIPVSVRAQLDHAKDSFANGKYDTAIKVVSDAINRHPGISEVYATRGVFRQGVNKHAEAAKDFSQAISLGLAKNYVYLARAQSKLAIGDSQGAILDCTTAINLDRNSSYALVIRGSVRTRMRQYDLALGDLDQAIAIDSKNELAYMFRAICKLKTGDELGAVKDFAKHKALEADSAANDGYRSYDGQPFTNQ